MANKPLNEMTYDEMTLEEIKVIKLIQDNNNRHCRKQNYKYLTKIQNLKREYEKLRWGKPITEFGIKKLVRK